MAELYDRIEKLCKDKGVSITEMCKQSGASRGSLTDLKMGRIGGLSLETLEKLMKYFDISLPDLLGTETKKSPSEDGVTMEQIKIALFGDEADIVSDEDVQKGVSFALFSARERKQRGDNK